MAKKREESNTSKMNFNVTAVLIQVVGIILIATSLAVPEWLANPGGVSYYPYSRSWGLLTVSGRQVKTHTQQWRTMCQIAGKMSLGITCISPLCNWYSQKCGAYRMVFGTLVLSCLLTLGSIILSLRRSVKAMRFATAAAFAATILVIAAITTYIFGMGQAFSTVNSAGYYPVPSPSVSLIIACVGCFFFLVGGIFHVVKWRSIKRESDFIEDTRYEAMQVRDQMG